MTTSTKRSTASSVFVDTSGFFASLVARDDMHARAARFLRRAGREGIRLVTTDYVLDETVTLLRARGLGHLAEPLLQRVMDSKACGLEWMDAFRFGGARRHAVRNADTSWSFTDCLSFVVMKELGLHRALTKDRHFRDAGFDAILV
jgi:predicted nucleic acid-binding protein